MHVYIARQPIFDRNKRLYAYELLYRESCGRSLAEAGGDRATTSLLSSAFLTEGIETITGAKPCFINFTEDLLTRDIAGFFPKTRLVVEVLEDVRANPKVVEACGRLAEAGYLIALDDFVYRRNLEPLIELADIIKIDFRASSLDEIDRMIHRLSRWSPTLLAEKIETYPEFEQALKRGFTYFQGYFFSRPEIIRIREVPTVKLNLINLLAEVNRGKTTVERLEKIISADLGITYKLLRYINSAYFYLLSEVTTVRQAIVYLGAREIRRFVTLVIISELATDKPLELVRLSIVRARFCELLARAGSSPVDAGELFLLGLFSLLDAILDRPMNEIVDQLSLATPVKEALADHQGELFPYLAAVTAYERGELAACSANLERLAIAPDEVCQLYLNAVGFADFLLRQ